MSHNRYCLLTLFPLVKKKEKANVSRVTQDGCFRVTPFRNCHSGVTESSKSGKESD